MTPCDVSVRRCRRAFRAEKADFSTTGEILTSGYTLAPADPTKKTTKVTYVVQVRYNNRYHFVHVCRRARLYESVHTCPSTAGDRP